MVTPSAPTLGSVKFEYSFPLNCPPKSDLLKTDEEKTKLCDATDQLVAGFGNLREVDMDFCKGSVTLDIESYENAEYRGTMLIDVVAAKFFKDNKDYIASLNPAISQYIESNVLTKDIREISHIFYRCYERYVKEYTDDEYGLDSRVEKSTIMRSKPGFKNFHDYCHYDNKLVTNLEILREKSGEKFKKFIQTLPTSLLSQKGNKKAALFLQEGLNQRAAYSDKLLYLRQVLFLLVFQDTFRDSLCELRQSLNIERSNLYTSSNRSHDISQESDYLHRRIERLETTLSKLPINDVALLIPLACRSSIEELSGDVFLEDCCIKEDSLARECNKARQADLAIRDVLENSFHVTPKSFAVKGESDLDNATGIESIESYLMGVSGLTISHGLIGRLAMRDHHTVYYKRESHVNILPISDNFPIEFLLTAAQFYPAINDNWIEESCLGYIIEMMGQISPDELKTLKSRIQRVRESVRRAPVDTLLKEKAGASSSRSQQHVLRDSGIKKLQTLYEQTRARAGLPPLR